MGVKTEIPPPNNSQNPNPPAARRWGIFPQHYILPLLFFLTTLFLVFPIFFLALGDINPFDEAAYINSGRMLLSGNFPSYADNPLVDVFYALTYLPFSRSPYWLVQSASLGRLLLFTLLWLSMYLVARRLTDHMEPLIPLGIFLVTPLVVEMLRFPSDPLFAGFAGLAFWKLLSFREAQDSRQLLWASGFLGLAALARNDGLVLFPIFLVLVVIFSWGQPKWWKSLLAGLAPFIVLVGGYVLLQGAVTGETGLGTLKRTYLNFEAGQESIYAGTGALNPVVEARLEARRIFGTAEENNNSVFQAIRRNPGVYLQRVRAVTLGLPRRLLDAYGLRFAALLFLLAGRGVLALIRRRDFALLAAFLLWPVHLATGFLITIFRLGHLQFPYYIVFGLAAIGLTALLANLADRRERLGWTFALLSLRRVQPPGGQTCNLLRGCAPPGRDLGGLCPYCSSGGAFCRSASRRPGHARSRIGDSRQLPQPLLPISGRGRQGTSCRLYV